MKYLVYLTYCTESKKIYVGVHETKNENVFDGYIGNGVRINVPASYKHPTTPFKRAVKKYGINKFSRITLAVLDTKKEAYELEKKIVTVEFIKRQDTYNIKLGGEGGCPETAKKRIYMYDSNGDFVKDFNSLKECMDYIDPKAHNQSHISRAIKYGTRVRNFQFSYEKVPCMKKWKTLDDGDKRSECMLNRDLRKVGRYDDNGNLLEIFNSSGSAQKAGYKNVQQVLKGVRQHSKGFVFKYLESD